MNTKRKYQHNAIVEERMFAMDIESLKQYDDQFKKAYETGEQYEFNDIAKLDREFILFSSFIGFLEFWT